MHWSNSDTAWESRHTAVEVLMNLLSRGRLCLACDCMARSEIGFVIEHDGKKGLVAFCVGHAPKFAAHHSETIRGMPKILEDAAVLSPPFTRIDGDDVVEDDGIGLDDVYDREPNAPKPVRRAKKPRRKSER